MLPASNSNSKGSSDLLNNTILHTVSFCNVLHVNASATSSVPATVTSFTVTSFTLQAAATPSTVPAAVSSFTLQDAAAAATASTVPVAATSFTLPVSNSYNKGPLEAKNKCSVAKIGGIKLETYRNREVLCCLDISTSNEETKHSISYPMFVLRTHQELLLICRRSD
jgi:hypothetical protein